MIELIGTWRLVDTESRTLDGALLPTPYGDSPTGIVTFRADGRMLAALCDGRAELPDGTPREFVSYCGNYTYDGARLVTRVDATSDAARLGTEQIRSVSEQDGLLVLQPPVETVGDIRRQRTLRWARVGDA
ncbi:MAG: lipocalin-like domain-containing protein [Alphaproteobacteria bacterium]|nr:lipocalin-like domain-containing protein [Alphaproteobacteria bacterium]